VQQRQITKKDISNINAPQLQEIYIALKEHSNNRIEDIYENLFKALSIKRNKLENLSTKRIHAILNGTVKKLPDKYPHLLFYGNDYTIESLLRFPEILIHENDEKLRHQYLSYCAMHKKIPYT